MPDRQMLVTQVYTSQTNTVPHIDADVSEHRPDLLVAATSAAWPTPHFKCNAVNDAAATDAALNAAAAATDLALSA